jgi:hypothetical protein
MWKEDLKSKNNRLGLSGTNRNPIKHWNKEKDLWSDKK